MFRINKNQNQSFLCAEHQTIVESARLQMEKVPYACTRGGCGYCKAKVLDGSYHMERYAKSALSDGEVLDGIVLLCKTYPRSDLKIICE
ncbi:2Fe-2S iron-sulfur cluster-binding protein [Niallia sp. XMNu-256]|uniref:2Fe-2S iron-sulfur cluster-binding protein n=1 Tax=Niallia sp. XMNu-256 TaxID=3082444 RepID=UPI0030CED2FE